MSQFANFSHKTCKVKSHKLNISFVSKEIQVIKEKIAQARSSSGNKTKVDARITQATVNLKQLLAQDKSIADMWKRLYDYYLSKGKNCYYSSSPLSCHRVHPEQGQIAFLDNDIQIIGRHWGKKLTKEFLLKNNYSFLFLNLISFTKISFSVSEQNSHDLIRLLASHFAYSNLKRTYQSLKKINIFMLVIELRSLFHFIQELGLMEMLVCYYMAIKRYIKT